MIHSLQVHLIYASIVWLAAWLLTSMPAISAATKYWIWVATSVNFVLPLGLVPPRFWPAPVLWFSPRIAIKGFTVPAPLIALWTAGALVMLLRLLIRVLFMRPGDGTPSVVGLIRPRIHIPTGLDRLLDANELDAVLAHERTHARRRDNLIRLFYELTLCALWFHPLVWISGSRLALFRELSCDEAVADGRDLISALGKLAERGDGPLLHATASSFIAPRIEHLCAPQRTSRAVNAFFIAIFVALLIAAAAGPIAEAGAGYLCALSRGLTP